eukprot:Amastigsp_a841162_241.p3 type:complete len:197 gc:universal Amastigsp_a841162_241:910-320(-)
MPGSLGTLMSGRLGSLTLGRYFPTSIEGSGTLMDERMEMHPARTFLRPMFGGEGRSKGARLATPFLSEVSISPSEGKPSTAWPALSPTLSMIFWTASRGLRDGILGSSMPSRPVTFASDFMNDLSRPTRENSSGSMNSRVAIDLILSRTLPSMSGTFAGGSSPMSGPSTPAALRPSSIEPTGASMTGIDASQALGL